MYSKGELPKSNPSTFFPSRSPAVKNPFDFIDKQSSSLAKGVMLSIPCAKAVVIHEVARRISTTTTVLSCTLYRCMRSGLRQTSIVFNCDLFDNCDNHDGRNFLFWSLWNSNFELPKLIRSPTSKL